MIRSLPIRSSMIARGRRSRIQPGPKAVRAVGVASVGSAYICALRRNWQNIGGGDGVQSECAAAGHRVSSRRRTGHCRAVLEPAGGGCELLPGLVGAEIRRTAGGHQRDRLPQPVREFGVNPSQPGVGYGGWTCTLSYLAAETVAFFSFGVLHLLLFTFFARLRKQYPVLAMQCSFSCEYAACPIRLNPAVVDSGFPWPHANHFLLRL
jgi:hypothetical protein